MKHLEDKFVTQYFHRKGKYDNTTFETNANWTDQTCDG